MFGALFVLYATRELGVTPGQLGLILGLAAVGGLARRRRRAAPLARDRRRPVA